ncbi:hypothetical protein RF11_05185 [Thelohanellus kitauei]|uniref:ISXO2-like transposase domain-containing protein n=1 Tax=Thelohanellus kitauei TaxID=669202 RepID=A0A0C2IXP9_THEKT|nr:hypothetical protein RF11_05185 [Thelohanellus kitauei]
MKAKTPQHYLHSDANVVGHIYLHVLVVFCRTWIEIEEPIYSNLLLDVSKLIIIDSFNHCHEVCRRRNLAYFNNHQLGNRNGQRIYEDINENGQLDPSRNQGRRISGPWIFGLLECHRQPEKRYRSGELRLFIDEKRDQESLLTIIRGNAVRGSMISSNMWSPYMQMGQDSDGLIHESVNHSERFVTEYGVHTKYREEVG